MKSNNKWKESVDFIPEKKINTWHEFQETIRNHKYRDWVYRGQSSSEYEINSSLYRLFEDIIDLHKIAKNSCSTRKILRIEHERLLIEKFKSHAPLFLNYLPNEDEKLEWLSIMQHFGAPTRLIDATFSPYIALFFAFESGKKDASFYAFRPKYYRKIDKDHFEQDINSSKIFQYDNEDESFFVAYEPRHSNQRLMAQQGLFLVSSKISEPFKNILGDYPQDENNGFRLILSASMRVEGLRMLRKMNITSSVLFPGIDGFCKSLHSQIIETKQRLERFC